MSVLILTLALLPIMGGAVMPVAMPLPTVWPMPADADTPFASTQVFEKTQFANQQCDLLFMEGPNTVQDCRTQCSRIFGCWGFVFDDSTRCVLKSCHGAPTVYSGSTSYLMSPSWRSIDPVNMFNATLFSNTILQESFYRYQAMIMHRNIQQPKFTPSTQAITISVEVKGDSVLSIDVDESYNITITYTGALVTANTVYGAMHGLETISQIAQWSGGDLVVPLTTIMDTPRFKHRGLLIDSSRHFLPLSVIFANIDTLSYNKMNVLHWHISDDTSNPYDSQALPKLKEGAFSPSHVYSLADVRAVVKYAQGRGVRVVPEFDSPAHMLSFAVGYPELLTYCGQVPTQGVYPIANSTYEFMETFWAEIVTLFPDEFVHLGGDELNFNCWNANGTIQAFMKERGWNASRVQTYYMDNIVRIVNKLGRQSTVWQEVFLNDYDHNLPKETVVACWAGPETYLQQVVRSGYRALFNSDWYENYIAYGSRWMNYYQIEFRDNLNLTESEKELILGAEASMWGEFVDATNSLQYIWPWTSAAAERLWSPRLATSVFTENSAAYNRLHPFRCSLVARGIPAAPGDGPNFCDQEFEFKYTPNWA